MSVEAALELDELVHRTLIPWIAQSLSLSVFISTMNVVTISISPFVD
jgi:hypothetical protein